MHHPLHFANRLAYEAITPARIVEEWRKRWHLAATAMREDRELSERLGGHEAWLALAREAFGNYTWTRFQDLVDRYGLVTGPRADCIEAVNLASLWSTYYHFPEDILSLGPTEAWVRKYDCARAWPDPSYCALCRTMESTLVRAINPRVSFTWTRCAGAGDSYCEGCFRLEDHHGSPEHPPAEARGVSRAHDFRPKVLDIYRRLKEVFRFPGRRVGLPRACDDPTASHTPIERLREFVFDIVRRPEEDIEEQALMHCCFLLEQYRLVAARLGEADTTRIFKRVARRYWSSRFPELVREHGLYTGPEVDCIEAANLFYIHAHYYGEPEERVEVSEQRVVVRKFHCHACEFHPPLADLDRSMRWAGLRTLNPRLSFRYTRCRALGDPYCEVVYELGGPHGPCRLGERFPDAEDEQPQPLDLALG